MGSPCGHFLLHFVIQLLTCKELSTCHILANVHFKKLCLTFTKRVVLYAFDLWLQKQKCKWVGPRGDKCYICSSDLKSSGRWKIWKLNSLLVWVFFLINSCNIYYVGSPEEHFIAQRLILYSFTCIHLADFVCGCYILKWNELSTLLYLMLYWIVYCIKRCFKNMWIVNPTACLDNKFPLM